MFERGKIRLSIGRPGPVHEKCEHAGEFLDDELRTVVSINDGKIIFDKGEIFRNGAALHLDQGLAVTTPARRRSSTKSLPACQFGRSARRTRHNFMSRCRGLDGRCTSLLIAR